MCEGELCFLSDFFFYWNTLTPKGRTFVPHMTVREHAASLHEIEGWECAFDNRRGFMRSRVSLFEFFHRFWSSSRSAKLFRYHELRIIAIMSVVPIAIDVRLLLSIGRLCCPQLHQSWISNHCTTGTCTYMTRLIVFFSEISRVRAICEIKNACHFPCLCLCLRKR